MQSQRTAPQPVRKRRRRRKNLSLYYLMILLVSGFIIFLLSRTVLFRINEYVVTGTERYSEAQILNAGNLSTGRNMYGVDTEKTEQRIMDTLIYVESVEIKRKLPDKLIVKVVEAKPFACCQYEGSRYAVISRKGKYLETEQASPRTELMQITGMELTGVSLGAEFKSSDPNKETILMDLFDSMDTICPGKITYIDITDRTDIVMGYDGRIDIEFGSSLDYDYKLRYITAIIEDKLSADASGRIIYHSASAGASFVTNEDLEQMQEDIDNRKDIEDAINENPDNMPREQSDD